MIRPLLFFTESVLTKKEYNKSKNKKCKPQIYFKINF